MIEARSYFVSAPFAITASQQTASCWADRAVVKESLLRLCRGYTTRDDSSLDIMWANLGAGKSHALYHLMYLLGQGSSGTLSIYVEFPDQPKRFLDVFKRLAPHFLGESLPGTIPTGNGPVQSEVFKAIRVWQHGTDEQRGLLMEWLTGGKPQLRGLRDLIGIGSRIEDDTRACDILNALIALYTLNGKRVVLLIDEFQRLSACRPGARDGILASIRTVFNNNPTLLSVILAATTYIEESASSLLSPELRSLTGLRPGISLPEMSSEEAEQFLLGRLACFRPNGYSGDPFAPFGREGLLEIVRLGAADGRRLIPRTLLQFAGLVYDEVVALELGLATPDLVRNVVTRKA